MPCARDSHIPDDSEHQLDRRQLLKVLGTGALGFGFTGRVPTVQRVGSAGNPPGAGAAPVKLAARPFPLQRVWLLESEFLAAQQRDARYLLELDADRLLHNFRVNAGLPPKAPVYGGWESQEPWVDIRCHGHTLGHWLTAGSLMYAATGDARFRERIDYIVGQLQACQAAAGSGLVCAFPDGATQLENAARGERFVGVPWYTMHKIFAGLRDAHLHAGSEPAKLVLARLAEWAWQLTQPMSDAGFEQMLRREHGGMNEVLADVYVITGDERYLALARRFSHQALLEPLAAERDTLDGLHANTQIPKVIGFLRLYELTGEPHFHTAARFFWETVVRNRSFATGGHGDVEHFFPVAEFPQRLDSAKTMETCCTHNMLRLTRMLFGTAPTVDLADHYELALYNSILAAQDPDTGWNTYFQPTRPGYLKLYHTPIDSFWCCTGSGIENHAKYGDSIYFQADDALFVNLFIPSVLDWQERGITVRQVTEFPDQDNIRLEISAVRPVRTTLNIRYPSWSGEATLRVNGTTQSVSARPGSWLPLRREWRSGDVVDVRFPMSLRAQALPGAPDRVALLYGPLVLAGRLGRAGLFPGADILRNERTTGDILNVPVEVPALNASSERVLQHVRPVAGEPLTFRTAGIGQPEDVTLVPYHRLHHERYNLYWQLAAGTG